MNIWQELPKPIFALAPMEGVTDTVFRQIINKTGKPSLFFTEFTNVDGLFSKGKEQVEHRLLFEKIEKPIIAQLWGMRLENYEKASRMIEKMGFDGIDINMGCPEKNVVKRGACAGLIHNHALVEQIINTVRSNTKLPVSVKTRIGIEKIETEEWISFLLKQDLDALTVHLRTVREQSEPPAHWEEMTLVVALRNKINPRTRILGNGDITSIEDAKEKIEKYKIDGVMVGRGIFHDPFLFDNGRKLSGLTLDERLELLLAHASLFEKTWARPLTPERSDGKRELSKNFAILKKFFKIYTLGLPSAVEIRTKLMEAENLDEVKQIVQKL